MTYHERFPLTTVEEEAGQRPRDAPRWILVDFLMAIRERDKLKDVTTWPNQSDLYDEIMLREAFDVERPISGPCECRERCHDVDNEIGRCKGPPE